MARPTANASAAVPVTSLEVYQYTTSAPAKKAPEPRNSQPSTFMSATHFLLLPAVQDRDRLLDPVRSTAPLDVRVVRLEGGPLGTDPRDPVEVVPRRRAGGRPFERTGVAPGVFLGHLRPVPPGDVHVPEEHEHGQGEQPGSDGG